MVMKGMAQNQGMKECGTEGMQNVGVCVYVCMNGGRNEWYAQCKCACYCMGVCVEVCEMRHRGVVRT